VSFVISIVWFLFLGMIARLWC